MLTAIPNRLVLDNVPEIKFFDGQGPRCPEDLSLPSVMRALMEYLGEEEFGCQTCRALQPGCKVTCAYSYFTGVSGMAAFLSWKKGWEGDNGAYFYMSADPNAAEKAVMRAAGYTMDGLEKVPRQEGEALFRQRIIEEIQKGRPVVAYGVVGPPEPALVTGYDEGGDVLTGWSFFQKIPDFATDIEFEPNGYFRKRNWFENMISLMFIGEKQPRPPLKEIYRDSLKWMVEVATNPIVRPEADAPEWYRERANGLAAYGAWAEQIVQDGDFPADEAVLFQRHDVHNNVVGGLAEARWYGSQYLIQINNSGVLHYGLAEDLLRAAACYAAEHDLMWKLWDLAGGNGNPEAFRKFADPALRREMVPIILEARKKDAEAVECLRRALEKEA